MKCWICGKEESSADIKISVDRLIGAVQEQFEREQSYAMACKKPWYKWTPEEKETYTRCDRERYIGNDGIRNLCEILGLDWKKLDTIARLARKWEEKRNYQYCFPAQEHAKLIMSYLVKNDPFIGPYVNHIHWKINNGQYRKDYDRKVERVAKSA